MAARSTKGRGGAAQKRRRTDEQAASAATAAPVAEEGPGRRGRPDDGTAFMPDPGEGPARIDDSLAENLAEEFLESATRGEPVVDDVLEEVVPEEIGGPFLETTESEEFAGGTDGANPPDAEREPLPRPVAGLVQSPREDGSEPR